VLALLLSSDLSRKKLLDNGELSEVRFSDHDHLTEEGVGYTFLWNGMPKGEPRQSGVAIVIKKNLTRQLAEQLIAINDPIIKIRLWLKGPHSHKEVDTLVYTFKPVVFNKDFTVLVQLYVRLRFLPLSDSEAF
jgi:hypothetical protein